MKLQDSYLVQVLDTLEEQGLLENTLIVRTSDHGEMGLAHGGQRQKMFNFYEETLRVPMIYSNPKLFPEPVVSHAMVSHVDFPPTIANLFDIPRRGPAGRVSTTPGCCSIRPAKRRRGTSRLPTTTTNSARSATFIRARTTMLSASGRNAISWRSTSAWSTRTSRASGKCTTSRTTRWRRGTWVIAGISGRRRKKRTSRACSGILPWWSGPA